MTNRRGFLKRAGLAGAGAVGASTLAAPYVKAQGPIKWRLQTYAGAPLGAFVIKPAVDAFNAAANGEMTIELFFADQLVPQGELFRAVQQGTLDAAQSDDTPWARRPTWRSSAPISPSRRCSASTCRRSSPTTG